MRLFTITTGTARIQSRSARAGWAGQITKTVRARSADAAVRALARMLERRNLRPVGQMGIQEVRG